jgi:hypothetical protein
MWILVDAEQALKNPVHAEIQTTLVIDSVRSDNAVQFHFEVENGQVPIYDIRTRTRTPHFSWTEIETSMPRRLVAAGKISIPGPPSVIRVGAHNGLIVNVAYKAVLHHQVKELWSTSRFFFGPDVKSGVIYPEGVNHGEGSLAFEEESRNIDVPARFAQPEGSWGLSLNEINPERKLNVCRIRNKHRAFLFDPQNRIVIFETTVGDENVQQLWQRLGSSSSGYHTIMLVWDASGALLSVDGNEVRTPGFLLTDEQPS